MKKSCFAIFLTLYSAMTLAAPKVIPFWHSFSGHLGQVLGKICSEYNHKQDKYLIKPLYKGDYTEALTSFAAAKRAHLAPPLIQIFEVGTATMLAPQVVIKPIYQIMDTSQFNHFLPAIKNYYSDDEGRLLAMPFNSSVPVLYTNQTILKKAGVKDIPTTWEELEKTAKKIKDAGFACAYTSTYPSWIHLEAFSSIHALPFSNNINGRLQVKYNQPQMVKHIQQLVDWKKQGLFEYGGRDSDATALFTSGHCAMLTQSSGSYISLSQLVTFDLGVAAMPFSSKISKRRYNSIIGGAALWVVNGYDDQTYKGIADFFAFLAKPKTQAYWHQNTGYLPVSKEALAIAKPLASNPIVVAELSHDQQHRRIRLGNYAQIRMINDEELEAAFAGMKTSQQALDDAVTRVNHLLNRFHKNVT